MQLHVADRGREDGEDLVVELHELLHRGQLHRHLLVLRGAVEPDV
jgi:hypothetical protein